MTLTIDLGNYYCLVLDARISIFNEEWPIFSVPLRQVKKISKRGDRLIFETQNYSRLFLVEISLDKRICSTVFYIVRQFFKSLL